MSEMVNYSLKMEAGQRDLLQKLIGESDLTAGGFIGTLLSQYEATRHRSTVSEVQELNQLRNHLARIEEIYIGLAKSRHDASEQHAHHCQQFQEQITALKAELLDARQEKDASAAALAAEAGKWQEALTNQQASHQTEIQRLQQERQTAAEAAQQAANMLAITEQTLQQAVSRTGDLETTLQLQQTELRQTAAELQQLRQQFNAAQQEIAALTSQLTLNTSTADLKLQQLKQQYELDKQTALLSAQQLYLEKREQLQADISTLREQLADLREQHWRNTPPPAAPIAPKEGEGE